LRSGAQRHSAIGIESGACSSRLPSRGIGCGAQSIADEQVPLAHGPRRRIAFRPTDLLGAEPVALAKRLARPRSARLGILLRVILETKLDRIHAERVRELVERALERV